MELCLSRNGLIVGHSNKVIAAISRSAPARHSSLKLIDVLRERAIMLPILVTMHPIRELHHPHK